MAENIGNLVIELQANVAGLRKDMDSARRTVEGFTSNVTSTFRRMAAGLASLGIGNVIAGQFRAAIKWADGLADSAKRLKVSTEFLQAFRVALRDAGGEIGSADSSLQALNKALGAMVTGVGAERIGKAFAALGFTPDQIKQFQSAEQLLPVLADRLVNLGSAAEQVAIAEKLGIAELLPLLQDGADGFAALTENAARTGQVLDESAVKALARANDELERMGTQLQVLGAQLFVTLIENDPWARAAQRINSYNTALEYTAALMRGLVGLGNGVLYDPAAVMAAGGGAVTGAGRTSLGQSGSRLGGANGAVNLFAPSRAGGGSGGPASAITALTEAQRDYNAVIAFIAPQLSEVAEMELKIARARAAGLLSGGQLLAAAGLNTSANIGGIASSAASGVSPAIKPGVPVDNSVMGGIRREFIEGMRSLPQIVAQGFDNIEGAFRAWIGNMLSAMADMLAQRAGDSLASLATSALGGLFAKGAAFGGGNVIPFASGGVVGGPTVFPMASGRIGLMGEAGPEAIMPLERGPGGRLGVRASGGGSVTVVNNNDFSGATAEAIPMIRAAIAASERRTLAALREMAPAAVRDTQKRGRSLARLG